MASEEAPPDATPPAPAGRHRVRTGPPAPPSPAPSPRADGTPAADTAGDTPADTAAGEGGGPPGRGPKGGGLKRAGLGIVDQGLYSVGNFALTILVARSVSTQAFGAYSIVAVTFLVSIAVTRGLTSETFVVRFSRKPRTPEQHAAWKVGAAGAAGTSLVAGLGAAVIVLAIGLVAGPGSRDGLGAAAIAFAVCLPGLAVQDFWRFAALARGRPVIALVNDAIVTVLQIAGALTLIATGHASVVGFVLAWGLGATVGAVIGSRQLRVLPRPSHAGRWWRAQKDLAGRYALDDLTLQVSQQSSGYVVAAAGGLAQTGALRAGLTIFGPPSILNLGVQTAVTPELVRLLARDPAKMRRAALYLGGGLAAVGALWGVLALVIPNSAGTALFGATWPEARPLLVFLIVNQVFNSVRVAPQASLRALADAKRTLRGRWINTAIGIPITVAAAATGDARNVAIGLAIASPLQAIGWWYLARRAYADHVAARAAAAPRGT